MDGLEHNEEKKSGQSWPKKSCQNLLSLSVKGD